MKKTAISLMLIVLLITTTFGQVKKTGSVGRMVKVSAYCLKGSKMANGRYPNEGYVAADPKYYKLGSKLYLNGRSYIVGDSGGDIKGASRFDVYLYSCNAAKIFGIKSMFLTL